MLVKLGATPVNYACMHCGGLSVGCGYHGVPKVTEGEAGASVPNMTGVVDLTARVADRGEYVVGATSLVMGAAGLMASD